MTFKGIIKNSKIETTIPLTLPEGTEVEITPLVLKIVSMTFEASVIHFKRIPDLRVENWV